MEFVTHCYKITALTNLHAGSGDSSYDILDKLVQRDPVLGMPVVHASSLKGALREYFVNCLDKADDSQEVQFIFGSSPKRAKGKEHEALNGEFRFYSADLLFLPVRSGSSQFYLATSQMLAKHLMRKIDLLAPKGNSPIQLKNGLLKIAAANNNRAFKGSDKVLLESIECPVEHLEDSYLKNINDELGGRLAILENNSFDEVAGNLPVIARNCLENGVSANLWYEEVVPHQSVFYTFVTVPVYNSSTNEALAKKAADMFKFFDDNVSGRVIQIGANATVGYGLCEFIRLT